MEELLDRQFALLQRLSELADRVADEAYKQQCNFTIDADLEAQEVKFALEKVGERLIAVQRSQRRRHRQS